MGYCSTCYPCVVAKKDGTIVDINIGEDDNDPVFCVTDLLIHLAQEQNAKNAAKVIEGETSIS
mgnify:CR=1 FL=1